MTQLQSTVHATSGVALGEHEWRFAALRTRLQDIFGEIYLVRDVITITVEAMHTEPSGFYPEMGRVLFRCGAEKLYGQLQELSIVIEQLGGRTELTEDCRPKAGASGETEHVTT